MTTEISKADFIAYENVRLSGVTNMFDVTMVGELTGLTRPQIIQIMENYAEYKEQFGGNAN